MRLTVYADYSLRMLIYLAVKGDGLATIADVADDYGISRNHLVKVAHQLGQAGYITTVRGKNGGLRLAQPMDAINLGDVIRRTEPDMALVPCFAPLNGPCPILPSCVLHDALQRARAAFLAVLDGYTLTDLARPRSALQGLLGIAEAPSSSKGQKTAQ